MQEACLVKQKRHVIINEIKEHNINKDEKSEDIA